MCAVRRTKERCYPRGSGAAPDYLRVMATPRTAERRLTITDPAVMRALAHPARLSILEHLMSGEPTTATECAAVVELSPSATSYHLRALAKVGLIEEAPGRGDGRERLWRSPFSGYQTEGAGGPP